MGATSKLDHTQPKASSISLSCLRESHDAVKRPSSTRGVIYRTKHVDPASRRSFPGYSTPNQNEHRCIKKRPIYPFFHLSRCCYLVPPIVVAGGELCGDILIRMTTCWVGVAGWH